MVIQEGEIVENSHIGEFCLGMTMEQLLSLIGSDYVESEKNNSCLIIEIENAKFWLDKDDKLVRQIGVTNGFHGKFREVIGIDSTMADVKKYIGEYVEVYDTFELADIPGICFELVDDVDQWPDDYWNDLEAPIEWIFVYDLDF